MDARRVSLLALFLGACVGAVATFSPASVHPEDVPGAAGNVTPGARSTDKPVTARQAPRNTPQSPQRAGQAEAPARRQAADRSGPRYGVRQAPAKQRGAIRVGTYNVLNLFDHVDDPSLRGEHDDLPAATSDDRCRALAAAIRELDADILALEEVESLEALTWFRDTYLKGMGYDHVASRDVGYYRGVECSLLSRFPIRDVRTWPDVSLDNLPRPGQGWAPVPQGERLRFQRSPLMATVDVNDEYALTFFVVHHKAGGQFDHSREAEAIMINRFINELRKTDPKRNIIVLGDFNAAPWDKSVRVYLENGMIDALAHRSTERRSEESRLYRTHESERVLDYILLNSAAHRELVIGSAFVLGTLHPGDNYDWRTDAAPAGYASDHYPVAIDLVPVDVP